MWSSWKQQTKQVKYIKAFTKKAICCRMNRSLITILGVWSEHVADTRLQMLESLLVESEEGLSRLQDEMTRLVSVTSKRERVSAELEEKLKQEKRVSGGLVNDLDRERNRLVAQEAMIVEACTVTRELEREIEALKNETAALRRSAVVRAQQEIIRVQNEGTAEATGRALEIAELQVRAEKDCARRLQMCKATVARMMHIQKAQAWDWSRDRVKQSKETKERCRRVIDRILHTQLAGAFDHFCEGTQQLEQHRRVLRKATSRWQKPVHRRMFERWVEYVESVKQEAMEGGHALATERIRAELASEKLAQSEMIDGALRVAGELEREIEALKKETAALRGSAGVNGVTQSFGGHRGSLLAIVGRLGANGGSQQRFTVTHSKITINQGMI